VHTISRRSFLASTAATSFATYLGRTDAATTVYVRPEARSTHGQAMLKLYETAVSKMKNSTPQTNPTSWLFQWYTHWVKGTQATGAQDKQNEINRIYQTNTQYKSLAQALWETCQAHGGEDENFFLPWHRMFIYYFERIVRKACGNPNFALPYWDYSVSGPTHGIMPPEFTNPSSPLYVSKRNPGVNQGQPIDKNSPGSLNLSVLSLPTYEPTASAPGFCANLDGGIHGNVHVLIGNTQNMGSIPWSAEDPIFWMHHCNIDRLWASWNKNGGKNQVQDQASFENQQFLFADENNNKVTLTVKNFLSIGPLNYTYDAFEPAPADSESEAAAEFATPAPTLTVGEANSVVLEAEPVRVPLETSREAGAGVGISSGGRSYLIFKDFQTNVQPGVLYGVYLTASSRGSEQVSAENRVASINFFSAMHNHGAALEKRAVGADVTAVMHRIASAGGTPVVIIAPDGQPVGDVNPMVGQISLVTV
jgi:hypothetical protein